MQHFERQGTYAHAYSTIAECKVLLVGYVIPGIHRLQDYMMIIRRNLERNKSFILGEEEPPKAAAFQENRFQEKR